MARLPARVGLERAGKAIRCRSSAARNRQSRIFIWSTMRIRELPHLGRKCGLCYEELWDLALSAGSIRVQNKKEKHHHHISLGKYPEYSCVCCRGCQNPGNPDEHKKKVAHGCSSAPKWRHRPWPFSSPGADVAALLEALEDHHTYGARRICNKRPKAL